MSKLLAALVYQKVSAITVLSTGTEPLGNIMPWDKNIFCQYCLL